MSEAEEFIAALFPNREQGGAGSDQQEDLAPDRAAIAERHGIADLADQLVGTTAEEVQADAAARAALRQREPTANELMIDLLRAKGRKGQAIVDALHPPEPKGEEE